MQSLRKKYEKTLKPQLNSIRNKCIFHAVHYGRMLTRILILKM